MQRLTLSALILLGFACGDKGSSDDTGDAGGDGGDGGSTDADGDGFDTDSDCDDADATINPDATEVCDGVDNDCDDAVDDADDSLDASTASTFYPDGDVDGYGDDAAAITACDAPADSVTVGGDCDDADAAINPDAIEICDQLDNDCDTLIDDDDDNVDASTGAEWYPDGDGDSYGEEGSVSYWACSGTGGSATADDCDDTLDTVNPGEAEVCNDGLDNDCSGDGNDCDYTGDQPITDLADALWVGEAASDTFGDSVANVGDLNGDGMDDILMGADAHDSGGTSAGRAYLVYGSATFAGTGSPSTFDAWWDGENSYDYVGYDLDGVGDVNADGYDDFVVGAYGVDDAASTAGGSYLFYGGTTAYSGWAQIDDAAARFLGSSSSEHSGREISRAGDVDGDGNADFLVGGSGYDTPTTNVGVAYLVYGSATAWAGDQNLSDSPSFAGSEHSDALGYRHSLGAADLNGDGMSDLGLGAYNYDSATLDGVGRAYIFYSDGTQWSGQGSVDDADYTIDSDSTVEDAYFGDCIDNAGDLNADGYEDIMINAKYYGDITTESYGEAYVFFGGSTDWSGAGSSADADWILTGTEEKGYVGYDGASLGDFDGDGNDDLAVSGDNTDWDEADAGAVYVFYGDPSMGGAVAPTDASFIVHGIEEDELLGYSVAGGDFNGDGQGDLLTGAIGADGFAGAAYLVLGSGL